MKTVIVMGENNLTAAAADMLNPKEMKLIGFADTREETWNIFNEDGSVKENITALPVMPPEMAASLEPDCILVATLDKSRNETFKYLIYRSNYFGDVLFLHDLAGEFSIFTSALRRISRRLTETGTEGCAAEVGCGNGDTSWMLNALMPDRKLYLFDTFEGFDERDIQKEQELGTSDAKAGDMAAKNENRILARMASPDQVVLKKGYFPLTAEIAEEETFAFVLLDASLYNPTKSGLEFFFPRMSRGGVIMIPGYEDDAYSGVFRAVVDFEEQYGRLLITPLGDARGTIMVIHP